MRPKGWWVGLLVLVVALAGAAWLLSGDEAGGAGRSRTIVPRAPEAEREGELPAPLSADEVAVRERLEVAGAMAAPSARVGEAGAHEDGRHVAGEVVRASDGSPLAGVEVFVEPADGGVADGDEAPARQLTGEDGRFALVVPHGTRALVASFHDLAVEVLELPPGRDPAPDLRIVLHSGFRLDGRVLDTSGAPVAGARVGVEGLPWVTGRAGAGGAFSLRDVLPSPGAVNVRAYASSTYHARGTADVLVPGDPEGVAQVEIRLAASGVIAGTVADAADDRPLSGATVELAVHMHGGRGEMRRREHRVETDEQGRYRIESVPVGEWLVAVAHDGHAPSWTTEVAVLAGQTTVHDVRLGRGTLLEGRVTDSAGNPVPGARVRLERVERWGTGGDEDDGRHISFSDEGRLVVNAEGGGCVFVTEEGDVRTDESGWYAIEGLSAGEKRLDVSVEGSDLAPDKRVLLLASGTPRRQEDVVLSAGLVLAGVVVDDAGAALGDVVVSALRIEDNTGRKEADARTDARGAFALTGLAPGELLLLPHKKSYSGGEQQVEAGRRDVRLLMQRAPVLRGLVRDVRDGRPLPDFDLEVQRTNRALATNMQTDDGAFELELWEAGTYTVAVKVGGYERLELHEVRPDDTRDLPLLFELVPLP